MNHKGLYDNRMVVYPELDPFEYAREAIPTDDPDGAALFPDRDEYHADPNEGTLVFTGDLSLRVGEHDFHLLHTLGHTLASSPSTCRRSAWSSPATASSPAARPGS